MNKLTKRSRGRPKGSGKDDSAFLKRVADLLLQNPDMKPTTAIKRVIGVDNPSNIRRLQVKWKANREALLAAARERKAEAEDVAAAPRGSGMMPDLAAITNHMEQVRRTMGGPGAQISEQMKLLEQAFGPFQKMMKEIQNQQRMISNILGPREELRRISAELYPWRYRGRYKRLR